jgi:tetratricopeptide (TPR) repeat protein
LGFGFWIPKKVWNHKGVVLEVGQFATFERNSMNNIVSQHIWSQLQQLQGKDRADFCLSQGIEAYKVQNFEACHVLCGAAIDILFNLKDELNYSNILSAFSFSSYSLRKLKRYDEAGALSVKASNFLYKFNESDGKDAFEFAADCFFDSGRYFEALQIYEFIANDFMNMLSEVEEAFLFQDMAFCYQGLGELDQAILFFNRARKLFVLEFDPSAVALIDEELSLCHKEVGNGQEAVRYAQYSLDFAILMNDKTRLEHAHNRMGIAKLAVKEYDKALAHLRRAKELLTSDKNPDWSLVMENEESIAKTYEFKGMVAEAAAIRKRLTSIQGIKTND